MTTKELIAKLAEYPDDTPVGILYHDTDEGNMLVELAGVLPVMDIPCKEQITNATHGIAIRASEDDFLETTSEKQDLVAQYNDVADYLNFRLMIKPFESTEERIEAGLQYAKKKNYDLKYIHEHLLEAVN